jgi:predicted O-methyltransferase YrrM
MEPKRQKYQEYRDFILELVLLFKPRTYCEIGVKKGYVYNHIAPHVERAVAVDIAPFRGIYKKKGAMHYPMSSDDFVQEWYNQEDQTIDLLFIDGDHSKRQVLRDFVGLEVFVPEHTGLILLHDTYPISEELCQKRYCGSAWKAVKSLKESPYHIDMVTLQGPRAGLTIIRKAKTYGWMDNDTSCEGIRKRFL